METRERRDAGGVTAERTPSHFRCTYCGASALSTAIDYDRLGYPRCPACGSSHAP